MPDLHGLIYLLEGFAVPRLRASIRSLIRRITKISKSNIFGVSRLDVEEVFESLHQFVEYTLATVAAFLFSKNSAFFAAITERFSGFLQRSFRCPVRPQFQQDRSWSDPENSFFVALLGYFGSVKNILGFDPDEIDGVALVLFPLLANTSSCICRTLASFFCRNQICQPSLGMITQITQLSHAAVFWSS